MTIVPLKSLLSLLLLGLAVYGMYTLFTALGGDASAAAADRLKRPTLPLSGHRVTTESIRFQLRQPLGRMPSFAHLTDDEMSDLIAYLNTL